MNKEKEKITKLVLAQLQHLDVYKNISHEKIAKSWWLSGINNGNLRLTDIGKKAFEHADITHYEFSYDFKQISNWYQFFVKAAQKFRCPFYIGIKRDKPFVRVYDNKIAMMITLYGNIEDYLESIKEKA